MSFQSNLNFGRTRFFPEATLIQRHFPTPSKHRTGRMQQNATQKFDQFDFLQLPTRLSKNVGRFQHQTSCIFGLSLVVFLWLQTSAWPLPYIQRRTFAGQEPSKWSHYNCTFDTLALIHSSPVLPFASRTSGVIQKHDYTRKATLHVWPVVGFSRKASNIWQWQLRDQVCVSMLTSLCCASVSVIHQHWTGSLFSLLFAPELCWASTHHKSLTTSWLTATSFRSVSAAHTTTRERNYSAKAHHVREARAKGSFEKIQSALPVSVAFSILRCSA